ncbi:MAG: hypothetical protein ACE5IR_09885, partial [bacterium]
MKRVYLYLSMLVALPVFAFAQTQHFSFTANTGDSYSIVVTSATLDGADLSVGDEIGVFTSDDLCVGASVWNGTLPLAVTAWIDDSQTPNVVDGYTVGDSMFFRIWSQSTDDELDAVPTYAQGNGAFGSGAFAQVSLAASSGGAEPSGIMVTNTDDSGDGSLRAAITLANVEAGPDTILFNILQTDVGFNNDTGTWTIQPTTELPAISDSGLVIDGASQAAFIGSDSNPDGPEIIINGQNAGTAASGLTVQSAGNVVNHLVINGFRTHSGIFINRENARRNTITGNYLGTNAAGTDSVPNWFGIFVQDAANNTIGGAEPDLRNLISGNKMEGVVLDGAGAYGNRVLGNYIGTDVTGKFKLENDGVGVGIYSEAHDNLIGGSQPGERNIISGNFDGLRIRGSQNIIIGNYIGADVTGTVALGNKWDGISLQVGDENIVGGLQPGEGNLVCGNQVRGIIIMSNKNQVIGNYIGTDSSGALNLGNRSHGISMNYGAKQNIVGPANSIAFNQFSGVFVGTDSSRQNTITQNLITSNLGEGILLRDGGNANISPPTGITVISGLVSGTAPPQSTIEIFSDSDNDGKIYEGTT